MPIFNENVVKKHQELLKTSSSPPIRLFTNFIDENSANQGRLFRTTKRLLARTDELSFPDYHEKKVLANDINDFFVRKITKIRADIDATVVDDIVPTELGVGDFCTCLSLIKLLLLSY